MSVIDSLSLGGTTYSLRDNDGRAIIAGTESSTTSAHAYSAGDYFILNDTLYEATAAIAVGGTITVGTNCQATTVCGEVGELKSDLSQQTTFADATIEAGTKNYAPVYTNNTMNSTTGQQGDATSIRASTPGIYYLPVGCSIHSDIASGYSAVVYCFDESMAYLGYKNAGARDDDKKYPVFDGTRYLRFLVFNGDNNITPADAQNNVTFYVKYAGRIDTVDKTAALNTFDLFNEGVFAQNVEYNRSATYSLAYSNKAVNSSTGQQSVDSTIRASTDNLYYIPFGAVLHATNETGYTHVLFGFDESKNFIAQYGSSGLVDGVWQIPSTVRFFRVLAFYGSDATITPENAASNIKITAKMALDPIIVNNNLINGNLFLDGYYDGTQRASSDYKYVAEIPVKNGVKYKAYPRSRMIYIYNNGVLVNYVNAANTTEITAEGDGVAYVTFYTADAGKNYAFYADHSSNVLAQGDYGINTNFVPNNILNGKKWVVCGDSFTAGADSGTIASGRYKGHKIIYPYLIGNRNAMEIVPFFEGGRTLAFPETPDNFVNSLTAPNQSYNYQNIPADADYITIYLGINDSHHESGQGGDGEDPTGIIPLGTISDNTVYTYYGAWNVVLTWILTNRPFSHIGIIVSNGCDRIAYRTAQIEIAKKYGIPYIDFNGDERTKAMIRPQNDDISVDVKALLLQKQAVNYAGGNYHPNNTAHEYESYIIESFLKSI